MKTQSTEEAETDQRPTPEQGIEVIADSARQTTALAIRRRQRLAEETVDISDLALSIAVEFTEHRTCFADMGYGRGFCTGCEDIVAAGEWADKEMDRAGVPRAARTLPYETLNAPERDAETTTKAPRVLGCMKNRD